MVNKVRRYRSVVLIMVGLVALLWLIPVYPQLAQTIQLRLAQQQWTASPVNHYRLSLAHTAGCTQEIEVQREQVTQVLQAECGSSLLLPVTDLFSFISETLGTCAPGGCECDGYVVMTVSYDPQLGYPRQISAYVDEELYWFRWPGRLLHRLLTGTDCGRHPYASTTISLTLTPLS